MSNRKHTTTVVEQRSGEDNNRNNRATAPDSSIKSSKKASKKGGPPLTTPGASQATDKKSGQQSSAREESVKQSSKAPETDAAGAKVRGSPSADGKANASAHDSGQEPPKTEAQVQEEAWLHLLKLYQSYHYFGHAPPKFRGRYIFYVGAPWELRAAFKAHATQILQALHGNDGTERLRAVRKAKKEWITESFDTRQQADVRKDLDELWEDFSMDE